SNSVSISHRTRRAPHPIVLQAATHAERHAVVDVDFVELSDRHVAAEIPRLAAIPRDGYAAVSADDHVVRLVGIDPQRAIFSVHVAEEFCPSRSAIRAVVEAAIGAERVDVGEILGVYADLRVVTGPRVE